MDVVDRLPQTRDRGIYLKQQLNDKLIERRQDINKYGDDLPEVCDWKWGAHLKRLALSAVFAASKSLSRVKHGMRLLGTQNK